jgi:hypothetical protein
MYGQSSVQTVPDGSRVSKLLAAGLLTATAIFLAPVMIPGHTVDYGQEAYAAGLGSGNNGNGVGNTADLGNQGNDGANGRAAGGRGGPGDPGDPGGAGGPGGPGGTGGTAGSGTGGAGGAGGTGGTAGGNQRIVCTSNVIATLFGAVRCDQPRRVVRTTDRRTEKAYAVARPSRSTAVVSSKKKFRATAVASSKKKSRTSQAKATVRTNWIASNRAN